MLSLQLHVVRAFGVPVAAFGSGRHVGQASVVQVGVHHDLERARDGNVVAQALEDGDRLVDPGEEVALGPLLGRRANDEPRPLDGYARSEELVAESLRRPARLVEERLELRDPHHRRQRLDEREDDLDPLAALGGEQSRGAAEEARRRGEVAPRARLRAGGREQSPGALAERAGLVVLDAQLGAVPVGLREVVAEELVELDELAPLLLEPRGEACVEIGAYGLRKGLVGGIADQEVAKAEGVLAADVRSLRANELVPDERPEPR